MKDIHDRIARLEKSAARWRMAAMALGVVGIAAVSMGQRVTIGGGTGGMQAPVVTADQLVANKTLTLNDSNGKARIVLSAKDDNPAIEMKDKDDHTLLILSIEKDAAKVLIQDAAGKKIFSVP